MITDKSLRDELTESFNDYYDDIEMCLNTLLSYDDIDSLHCLFRAIHTIKGNAGMCGMESVVRLSHAMEEVAGALRDSMFSVSTPLRELFLIGMDRLRNLQHCELYDKSSAMLDEQELIERFTQLSKVDRASSESLAQYILDEVGRNFEPLEEEQAESAAVPIVANKKEGTSVEQEKLHDDLSFFQSLTLLIDQQSQYWEGRSIQIYEWALKLNKVAGSQINYEQLSAAIYMHDIGMSFLPNQIITKEGVLSDEEVALLRQHPEWGCGFLSRMPGWEEAAQIVLDHHEHFDGNGYPNKKSGDDIHPGAKILAVIDAFFSITNHRADREHRKSTIKAISEINSCAGTQFDMFWVQHFNQVLKAEMKEGFV